ncbi:MAG: isoamylase early set domain-containing protein [Phycisphaerae bacterium]
MVTIKDEWVEFSFFRPQANQVHLAGDFNNWRERELPMVKTRKGYWTAKMRLPAGEFKFRYCADGEWFTDYAAFGVEPGRFGLDSVVRVPEVMLKVIAAPKTQVAASAAA